MSIPGERDETLERWLQQLRPGQRDATESCLDAETAAAWVAGGLSGDALQQAQAHLAGCDRCQMLVGSLVRADIGGEAKRPAPEGTWLRWLVPLTAAAAAVIAIGVWATLPRDANAPVSTVVESRETAGVPQPPVTPAADERSARTLSTEVPQTGAVAKTGIQPPAAKSEESRTRRDAAGRFEEGTARGTPPPAAAVAAAPPARPAQQTFSDAAAARAQSQVAAEAALPEIISPDQSTRWRITGRQVQKSVDRGATWEPVQVAAAAQFAAGSAPSRTVCWLVGHGGIVMLTTSGSSFTRVPFPEPADLIAVAAADARSAMVTTADGRTFRTSDGGSTWTR